MDHQHKKQQQQQQQQDGYHRPKASVRPLRRVIRQPKEPGPARPERAAQRRRAQVPLRVRLRPGTQGQLPPPSRQLRLCIPLAARHLVRLHLRPSHGRPRPPRRPRRALRPQAPEPDGRRCCRRRDGPPSASAAMRDEWICGWVDFCQLVTITRLLLIGVIEAGCMGDRDMHAGTHRKGGGESV